MQLTPLSPSVVSSNPPAPSRPVVATTRQHMSPEWNKLAGNDMLGYQIGRGSFAGALDDQVRFRVIGDGPITERAFVPDSSTTAALMQTKAGARLVGQLKAAMSTMQGFEGVTNLQGFILPKDEDGVVASTIMTGLEQGQFPAMMSKMVLDDPSSASSPEARRHVQTQRAAIKDRYARGVAAWNGGGWITFRPDVARMMLAAAGAYEAKPGGNLRKASRVADVVTHIPTHEVQHSITPVSNSFYRTPMKWMEEAVSQVLSDSPEIRQRVAELSGVTPKSYAGRLAHPPTTDVGWGPWKRPAPTKEQREDNERQVSRNYASSQVMLREMLELAGMGMESDARIDELRTFLQGEPVESLGERLAERLIAKHGIDPARRAELVDRIAHVVDSEAGVDGLAREFGIPTRPRS